MYNSLHHYLDDHHHGEEEESGSQESGSVDESSEHIQTLPSGLKKQHHQHNQNHHNIGQQQQFPPQHQQFPPQQQQFPPQQQQQFPSQQQQHILPQTQTHSQPQLGAAHHNPQPGHVQEGQQGHGNHSSKKLHDQSPGVSQRKAPNNFDYVEENLRTTGQSFGKRMSSLGKIEGPSNCVHHTHPFAFFCETCEEPICSECTIVGPHNNQLHRINRMKDSYKARYMKIQEQIQKNLVTKKTQILAQIHRIEYRVEEIKYVKTIIERDARLEYEGLLDRLRQAEGTKLALLNHDIAELQKDLDHINEVGSMFNQLTSSEVTDLSPFLLRSRQLYETTEHLVAKPFKTTIDVYPYDLPRELTELRLQLQRASAQQQLIEFKNEIIWKLLNKDDTQELEQQANQELLEWSRLVDNYQSELEKFQLVCCFCSVLLDPSVINLPCNKNSRGATIVVSTVEQPAPAFIGNERHFFSKPTE